MNDHTTTYMNIEEYKKRKERTHGVGIHIQKRSGLSFLYVSTYTTRANTYLWCRYSHTKKEWICKEEPTSGIKAAYTSKAAYTRHTWCRYIKRP